MERFQYKYNYRLQSGRSYHTTVQRPMTCDDSSWDLDGFPTQAEIASSSFVGLRQIDGSTCAVFKVADGANGRLAYAQNMIMCRSR